MKILSWNVNGLRSVHNKGVFLEWVKKYDPDIIGLQEIKAKANQLPQEILKLKGYYPYFNEANKPGYAGVAIYTKARPIGMYDKLGDRKFDSEGRFLYLHYKNFDLVNVYIPHGGRQKENYVYKLSSYDQLIRKLQGTSKKTILIGDFNVAHKDVDLARPNQNRNNIMFTPQERTQIDRLQDFGFVDTFRLNNPDGGNYTWWPYRANARTRNIGWRIDYVFTNRSLARRIESSFIQKGVLGSDHCPVGITLRI